MGYAATREMAIHRLQRALHEYLAAGIKTNIGLFQRILQDPDFCAGKLDTGYLDRLLSQPAPPPGLEADGTDRTAERERVAAVAAGIFAALESATRGKDAVQMNGAARPASSPWKQAARAEVLR